MSSSNIKDKKFPVSRGYVEGYYGKLLSWSDRSNLVRRLASLELNTYCYAPKEDAQHRLCWREPHSGQWHQAFQEFCTFAIEKDVAIIAGIAPGLDFNFDNTKGAGTGINDIGHLYTKASRFLEDGATDILVLWDDIEEPRSIDHGGMSEGAAHAHIVNELAERVGQPLWTVPRVYAAEIENKNGYLEDFFGELQTQHTVVLCGEAIVASRFQSADLATLTGLSSTPAVSNVEDGAKHRTVLWDNFYANDYCPRRLFVGPWTGREAIGGYLLNPTGMPYTDQLLLDIAAYTQNGSDIQTEWLSALARHGVPESFLSIAPFFTKPFFGDRPVSGDSSDIDWLDSSHEIEHAMEECLWRWKSPLAREWYPFIMSLKHDLALMHRTLPRDRVLKTQTSELSKRLLTDNVNR